MDLTQEQVEAAEARGCAFLPATDEQVGRLGMQRRIFRIDSKLLVATRDGGFFETHGTLAALIGDHGRDRKRGSGETAREAAAADAVAAADIAAEQGAARGGAQVVGRGAAKGPARGGGNRGV